MFTSLELTYPWAFLLLGLLPLIVLAGLRWRETIPFSRVDSRFETIAPTSFVRHYETLLFVAAYLCLVLSIVDISYARQEVEEFIESKWIFLTLDMSGSMQRPINRFSDQTLDDLALDGIESFIDIRGVEDYIGLVAFSSTPKLLAPLTFDRRLLRKKIELLRRKNHTPIYRQLTSGGGTNASEAVWLALSAFFSMLPEKSRLSLDEISALRNFLLGAPGGLLDVPDKLHQQQFGTGKAVILFTDGRIEPTLRAHKRKGKVPNLVNVIELMKALGIRFYIISVGGEVDTAVQRAMDDVGRDIGRIFVTAKSLQQQTIHEVYQEIDNLESNHNLTRVTQVTRSTRPFFAIAGWLLVLIHVLLRNVPPLRRL
ncbi:MAG: hypothetical protein BA874_08070 [Desulfuromonadales bacterium C00003068]|jgi:hypothetical protein|nr:MAG: hypothetical protein BA874_08070 [Desulfuromonadales bacterium C00003068]